MGVGGGGGVGGVNFDAEEAITGKIIKEDTAADRKMSGDTSPIDVKKSQNSGVKQVHLRDLSRESRSDFE